MGTGSLTDYGKLHWVLQPMPVSTIFRGDRWGRAFPDQLTVPSVAQCPRPRDYKTDLTPHLISSPSMTSTGAVGTSDWCVCTPRCASCRPRSTLVSCRLQERAKRVLVQTLASGPLERRIEDDAEATSTSGFSTGESAAPRSDGQTMAVVTKRRPVPGKGHTKSRTGCTSCKRRRVKCDEGLPSCGSCRRLALICEYTHQKGALVGASLVASPGRPLRTTPGVLEMADLRFFHHFLLEAYPPLPILGREVWQHVSQMSHQVGVSGLWLSASQCSHIANSMIFWRAPYSASEHHI